MLESIRSLIACTGMLAPGDSVVIAVSGGQDSCALLHALAVLSREMNLRLHAAHLNHGFRGAESDSDADFVRGFADSLGIPSTVEMQDVAGAARRLHRSKQDAARQIRHRFLERVADSIRSTKIALGHTRDDRVETILLNIVRGSGQDGLRGLAPISGGRIRPLLNVTRAETAEYCRQNGIGFRDDPSNLSPAYTRNRIRNDLLPLLESAYNPEFRSTLLRLSDLASDDADLLGRLAAAELAAATLNTTPGRIVLCSNRLRAAHVALARRMVRLAIEAVRGSLADVEFGTVERIRAAAEDLARKSRFQIVMPGGGVSVCVDREKTIVCRRSSSLEAIPFERDLMIPGRTQVPELNLAVETEVACGNDVGACGVGLEASVDAAVVMGPLVIRNRRAGDRVKPLGMAGTRKIQDILVDRKVAVSERDRVPIIADAEGILWIAGHALADRARVTDKTERVLRMALVPLEHT